MSETGAVYAKALFELAEETNAEEQMLSDLVGVTDLLKREPEYVRLMDSYAIPKKERVALLDKAFSGQVSELTLNLMKILVEENALFLLPDCRKAFKKLYNEKHKIASAQIVSAVALTQDQQQRLVSALEEKTGKHIEPDFLVEPDVRGGIRIDVEGVCYDNTILTRLTRLSRLLSGRM